MSHHHGHTLLVAVCLVVAIPVIGGTMLFKGASDLVSGKHTVSLPSSLLPRAFMAQAPASLGKSVPMLQQVIPGPKAVPATPEVCWTKTDEAAWKAWADKREKEGLPFIGPPWEAVPVDPQWVCHKTPPAPAVDDQGETEAQRHPRYQPREMFGI